MIYNYVVLVCMLVLIFSGIYYLRGLLFMSCSTEVKGDYDVLEESSPQFLNHCMKVCDENLDLKNRIRSLVHEKMEVLGIRKELQDYLISRAYEDLIINARVIPTIIESCNVVSINQLPEVPRNRLLESIRVLEAFDLAFQRSDNSENWYLRRDEIDLVTSRFNNSESGQYVRTKSNKDFTSVTETSKGES